MTRIHVYRNREKVPFSEIKEAILNYPKDFFEEFEHWFLFKELSGGVLFQTEAGDVSFVHFIEEEHADFNALLDCFIDVQEKLKVYSLQEKKALPRLSFLLLSSRFDDRLVKKLSFMENASFQLYRIEPLRSSSGETAYLLDALLPKTEPMIQEAQRPGRQTLMSTNPAAEKKEPESISEVNETTSVRIQDVVPAQQSVLTNQEPENPASLEEVGADDFFSRGKLSAEEELDFDKLNKKIMMSGKTENRFE